MRVSDVSTGDLLELSTASYKLQILENLLILCKVCQGEGGKGGKGGEEKEGGREVGEREGR